LRIMFLKGRGFQPPQAAQNQWHLQPLR